MKIITVAGARPNFMKIAPFMEATEKDGSITNILVHTGQHHDKNMSESFFEELGIPRPNYNLEISGGSHAQQTAKTMIAFEEVLDRERPELVVVVGDVNSTLACALTAKKKHIKVAHIESGLRSRDELMPEEINRVLTDRISDYLLVSEESGVKNLEKEGYPHNRIHYVGNIMIDTLKKNLPAIQKEKSHKKYGLEEKQYGVVTIHRPSNVDAKEKLQAILHILEHAQDTNKLIWPLHPRTRNNLKKFELYNELKKLKKITIIEPASYYEFNSLVYFSKFILTDSGGIQEETSFMGIPCVTLRENTERPSTVDLGTNTIAGLDEEKVFSALRQIKEGTYKKGSVPKFWDGKTANRIVEIITP